MTWIGDRLVDLLACVCDGLAASSSGSVCWCGVMGGDLILDACGSCDGAGCGQAWVRLTGAYPTVSFPTPADDATACGATMAYTVEVGVMRCVTIPDDGTPVEPGVTLDEALTQAEDMEALRKAILCCFDVPSVALREWVPMGPDGGCLGGAWSLTIGEF